MIYEGMAQPGKIVCIGRNYAAHAAEMNAPVQGHPVVFLKPSSALVPSGASVRLPPQSSEVHHELELVAIMGRTVRDISADSALEAVDAYALGLDMTARDLQRAAQRAGDPWSVAKGFDTFAPLGRPRPAAQAGDPQQLELRLHLNDKRVQVAHTRLMLFGVAELIAYCSTLFTLEAGDLLFTGTPEGVGPVSDGDRLLASADGFEDLMVDVRSGKDARSQ